MPPDQGGTMLHFNIIELNRRSQLADLVQGRGARHGLVPMTPGSGEPSDRGERSFGKTECLERTDRAESRYTKYDALMRSGTARHRAAPSRSPMDQL